MHAKLGKKGTASLPGVLVTMCLALPAAAQPPGAPQRVFACSLGRKSVSVTAAGDLLTYRFGTANAADLTLTASAAQRNVFFREDRYAGAERQLRFVNGEYSYTVYSMEGNVRTGAAAVSGLVVTQGARKVADMPCARAAAFGAGFDHGSLPQDTEAHSAM